MTFPITALDFSSDLALQLQQRIDRKTKPIGALGQLESLALQIGLVRDTLTPTLNKAQIAVFAGDHGAAKAGVSAYPQDVTWQMVENFLAGGAAINVFARGNGLDLAVVDAGVAHRFGPRQGLIDAKVRNGTRNYLEEPAMDIGECMIAITKGAELAWKWTDHGSGKGADVLGFGEMGIGNTASASLITHALTGTPLKECIGRGTGLDDAGLQRKCELLAQAADRAGLNAGNTDPMTALCEFGGFEIAMMVGAMLGAAKQRTLLLIDGFIVGAAALVAARLQPEVLPYMVFCHCSAEPGHAAQLKALRAEPLLDLGLRLGEGTGAALAWPLVKAAADFLRDMASFESAGVSDKS